MHEVLVKRLGGLSLPRKSVVRLTDRPDMTLDVYRGRKITTQQLGMSISRFPFLKGLLPREAGRSGVVGEEGAETTGYHKSCIFLTN